MPEPPDVAKTAIFLPERSHPSRNVLTILGATYHQIGKPISTVSYLIFGGALLMCGKPLIGLYNFSPEGGKIGRAHV